MPGGAPSAASYESVQADDLLGPAGLKAFQLNGDVDKVHLSTVPVEGQPFSEALRAEIVEGSGHDWAVQIQAKSKAPVKAGDLLLATFYLRTEKPEEGGPGETQFVFELAQSPYTKSITYPVQAGDEWAKVQVRFAAKQDYAAGDAQMIFRLGYDPETIQIGGVSVQNYAQKVAFSALPSTEGKDRARVFRPGPPVRLAPVAGGELAFEVDPGKPIRRISPYVYGINSQPPDGTNATVRRMGGNRQTAYNWEINASSAGSDWKHSNDDWPCTALGYHNCGEPGAQFLDFARQNRELGMESMVTIPLTDYVSADKKGSVSEQEKAPSPRWDRSYPVKNKPFSLSPDLSDGAVYQDEFVNLLVTKLGKASQGGIKFYSLDNEPALWPSTHPRIHPEKTTYQEMITRSDAVASAITALDPSAEVLGAVMFGWSEYLSLTDAPDSKELNAKFGGTYIDYYLSSMKRLEAERHRRLVHVLDLHWYPEVKGMRRITEDDPSLKTALARLQAPRSLWDPTYQEKSWIGDSWGKPIRLIPWLLEKIERDYPGTKLGMTEYNYGAGGDISGGLAQADVLGIFGREGMYVATYWGNGPGNGALPPYITAAFKLFRNFDGKNATFGDSAVSASTQDIAATSIYAATDSKRPGRLTLVILNKDQQKIFKAKVTLKSGSWGHAQVFGFDAKSPELSARGTLAIQNGVLEYSLPPLSASVFVCEKG